jgi:hypothetical protein
LHLLLFGWWVPNGLLHCRTRTMKMKDAPNAMGGWA